MGFSDKIKEAVQQAKDAQQAKDGGPPLTPGEMAAAAVGMPPPPRQPTPPAVRAQNAAPMPAVSTGGCPAPGAHYLTEVNKGSIRMQTWQSHLNDMFTRGYRLSHVFEQDGNTVQVYEHRHP